MFSGQTGVRYAHDPFRLIFRRNAFNIATLRRQTGVVLGADRCERVSVPCRGAVASQ
jgi:hypothetical protein